MAINFSNPETLSINGTVAAHGTLGSLARDIQKSTASLGSSKTATGIELRMLPPLIKDNHTPAFWPFPGYSSLYCLTIVVSDVTNESVGNIELKGFQRIGDHEYLPINKTVYYWQVEKADEKSPNQIHVMCTVMKSKKGLRDVAAVITSVKDDPDYKGLIGTLGQIAKNASKLNLMTDTLMEVAGIVGKYLKNVEDKPIGTIINSYTILHGDFDKVGVSQLLYPTRDVNFEFQMVVRDASAEAVISKSISTRGMALSKQTKNNISEKENEEVIVEMQSL